ncbi:flavin reductase family protein [Methanoregula sp.]|jgi:flavin reductase (DIM6/NTAB) family NADH-FMN oxidoreductase RutF|uniref:flavin reductase family protein n=1 Tax=Methanoregula sp. TaxID=2052170 RepID=UPI003C22FDAA
MKRSFGARTIAYPLPVFVVGTYDSAGKPDAMVAAWGGICSSDPPSIAVSIRPSRYTYKNLMETMEFTISIPSTSYMAQADYFGIESGEKTDKFAACGLTPVRADHVNAPYVGEFPVILECRVIKTLDLGAHPQFIGQILDVKIDESALDPEGRPDLSKINPLIFDVTRSEYYTAGRVIGKAFSAGRKYKK